MFYAAVGIKQIQAHLARSRHLWGRRGASDMLFYLTDVSGVADGIQRSDRNLWTVTEILSTHPGVALNPDAADTDGVVQLMSADRAKVEAAAREIAINVKLHLPAATVETSIREAATFVDTLRAERDAQPADNRAYPSSVIEFPLAHHCDECSSAMASGRITVREQQLRLCRDCASRAPGPRNVTLQRARETPVSGFMVEQRMLRDLKLNQVEDFKQLAKLGRLPEGHAPRTSTDNHIATIFADGNGLGALFDHLREDAIEKGNTGHLLDVSKRIKNATEDGLKAAIRSTLSPERDGAIMAAIPHILGGDDVLVSVPATRVWPFLRAFMTTMKDKLSDEAFEGAGSISFSAGVVICHQAFPIGDQVELAENLLRRAKKQVYGDGWTFAWQDVTNEGTSPGDRVLAMEDWPRLDELIHTAKNLGEERKGNTARATVRSELRIPDIETRSLRLRHLADRLGGAKDLFDLAFGNSWREGNVTDAHTSDLLAALSIMRWLA
ncbi:hypothetical protein SAMN02745244_03531 [Tessaracoccus bendigoensis DSM 12906]|uniref:GGDEF domain-containing protein n=1 Tax=Tessaracoccus bendigoensis DSM 12906 TaxID=1123357 RepID=A0A1M6N243_9ACTN|nr:hypothetical protein [Tessaracoccus bendigoensis]SHJ89761.1 hypothetical protein SAMN02745244_03531 [Tessaracoccus bendigoensis DSM 12906]